MNIIFQQNHNKKQRLPGFSLAIYVSNKSFLTVMTLSKNYRFGFLAKPGYIFNRKFSRRRTGTKHINKRWYILAKQLNFDLTWIFHTKKCILACFLAFSCLFFNILEKIPVRVFAKSEPAILLKTLVSGR